MAGLKDKFTNWESGLKDGVCTALSSSSRVYFTIAKGILTETYFPMPDTIVLHSLRFFINDSVDESMLPYDISIEDIKAPLYRVTTYFNDLTISKEFVPCPDSSFIVLNYNFSQKVSGTFKIFPVLDDYKIKANGNTLFIYGRDKIVTIKFDKTFKCNKIDSLVLVHLENLIDLKIQIAFTLYDNFEVLFVEKSIDFERSKKLFIDGWKNYLSSFDLTSKSNQYIRSIIAIKSMEDKTYRGVTVASLALPWGSKFPLTEKNGYHLVWVRDLFFTSLAMMSLGDVDFANASLEYMLNSLRRRDGSFKQNSTIEGIERWNATQMDQVAFPIILAYKLKRLDLIGELKLSADYMVKNGPQTEQERWEEIGGFSPYAMSLESRALELFSSMGDGKFNTSIYREASTEFRKCVPLTSLCKKGKFGDYYFVRISNGDADTFQRELFLKGEHFAPSQMVSNDFLYLVFTGLYPYFDLRIKESLKVADAVLKAETPKGPSFYRYNGDIYGFDEFSNPKGKLWVLLTAERGIFELMRRNVEEAKLYLNAIENFATNTYVLPEQVFEDGTPTESAAPLAWSHAIYMVLFDMIEKGITPSFQNPWL